MGFRLASCALQQASPYPFLLSSISDYVIDDKVAVLQKRDHEGFGFVLRGAKGNGWGRREYVGLGVRLAGTADCSWHLLCLTSVLPSALLPAFPCLLLHSVPCPLCHPIHHPGPVLCLVYCSPSGPTHLCPSAQTVVSVWNVSVQGSDSSFSWMSRVSALVCPTEWGGLSAGGE